MNNIYDPAINKCTGCQFCSAVCPASAISIVLDEDGFYSPYLNEKKCLHCGICKQNCYKFDENFKPTSSDSVQVYACQTKDKELLFTSSSGGIATHIAKTCIKQGYKILGVCYDTDSDIAVTCIAKSEEELEAFKGSKYIQSYTSEAFKELLTDKTEQKYAIFGTPCQIYAINNYINKKNQRDRFLLIDIFCHGCPSLYLWKKYVQSVKQKMQIDKFDHVEFRSKIRGWHEFCHEFKKGSITYKSKKHQDPFFSLFFDDNILCEACYNCKVRSTLAYTDIRLGDFWGSDYALNTDGISAVVLANEKGQKLFDAFKDEIWVKEHTLIDVSRSQSYGLVYRQNENVRRELLDLLKSDATISEVFKKSIQSYSAKRRLKLTIKKAGYLLPRSIRFRLKRYFYKMQGK